MKQILIFFFAFFALLQAEENIYHTHIDKADAYIISLKNSDVNKKILIPNNDAQKDFINKKELPQNRHNVVLIKGENFTALIDTGFKETQNVLFERLKSLKITPDSITHIIITHAHPDHIGGILGQNGNNFKNAELIIDKLEYDYWQKQGGLAKDSINAFKKISYINHDKYLIETPSVSLRALRAYGHTPGHNVIMIGENLVFFADLLHVFDIQIKMPNIAVIYDVNPSEAVRVRQNLLNEFRRDNLQVIGTHVPFIEPVGLE
ncbi:MBL fold metallo-hydrolase [Helicobacter saguini]|uniref:MBL fold metallo-hydrolase n=1 Tax=Helicobacter saguini TaxID=1548018 RepID=A0A347VY54_9HELI|nr:MBL fold metallo-hydrolase [Helicobacter saguini]MWV61355.1 MBL fold metallo-hydrolase [Helicobacter saguini]MWV67975.1 MBL fold metallo-hydrolase [Helicobacter saguini]MWV70557.1 MBL fold metallo-hydrolase [Helicobacter saguini]MWV72461.1 MBL fold metallo-hydrolase [Helicobacter saguini]TLD94784.1 MBL fold metallo-hydrolase [Helicobacter saguini]